MTTIPSPAPRDTLERHLKISALVDSLWTALRGWSQVHGKPGAGGGVVIDADHARDAIALILANILEGRSPTEVAAFLAELEHDVRQILAEGLVEGGRA